MNQEEVTKIYETLAPMAGDYMNAQAEQIGQAQSSMGPMAANVMGQSQTSGLGNYTYNRLMRPQVDTMRDTIMAQGYANQLNRLLSDALTKARNNYNKVSSGSPSNNGTNGWQGDFEDEKKDESKPEGSDYNPSDYVKNDYKFSNYGPLLGYSGQYPKLVESANGTNGYDEYTSGIPDPQAKAKKWYEYLKSIGYAG